MTLLSADLNLLVETFQLLRECGQGRRECVAYWSGPSEEPTVVDEVVHPFHTASGGGYEVESGWITSFFLNLRKRRRSVRIQIHTHPFEAGHSFVDDCFALVPAPHFLSLVVPFFAMGEISLDHAFLVRMNEKSLWESIPTSEIVLL